MTAKYNFSQNLEQQVRAAIVLILHKYGVDTGTGIVSELTKLALEMY